MNFIPNTLEKKTIIEIYILNIIILLYLFRPAIPQFKYPFILLFIFYFFYTVLIYKNRITSFITEYVQKYYLILFLVILFYLAMFFSNKLFLIVCKEAIEIAILLILLFIIELVISSEKKLTFFISNFLNITLVLSILIAVISTYINLEIQNYYGFYPANNYQNNFLSESLLIDRNFALIPVSFGFFILIYKLKNITSKFRLVLINLILLIFSLSIIISTSRRGLIMLMIIILGLIFCRLFSFVFKSLMIKKIVSNLSIFYLSVIIVTLSVALIINYGSYDFKVDTLKFLGVKDITSAKRIVTSTLYGLNSRFIKTTPYSRFNKLLWSKSFDPKDPDNGWGNGYYTTVFPLVGENVSIVPEGSIGYFLDKSCYFDHSDHHAYSNTVIATLKITENEHINSAVYCYVSSDFNGDLVCLRADGQSYGERVSHYELKFKGKWQKLSISAFCNQGEIPLGLYFNKQGVSNFSTLKGYVIFAYPQFVVETAKDEKSPTLVSDSLDSFEQNFKSFLKKSQQNKKNGSTNLDISSETLFCIKAPVSFTLNESSEVQMAGLLSPLSRFNNLGNLKFSNSLLLSSDTLYPDRNHFRTWIKEVFNEDTIYFKPKGVLIIDSVSTLFFGDRLSRWQFAIQVFSAEFNCRQKLFGGGFNYLNWYGYYFLKDKTQSDYPHNPFLSILLYSGIFGLLIYCFFLYKAFYYYLKYIKEYSLLFSFFLITFYFTFFSGGSPFDPPIFGFFSILPFFIHFVHSDSKLGL